METDKKTRKYENENAIKTLKKLSDLHVEYSYDILTAIESLRELDILKDKLVAKELYLTECDEYESEIEDKNQLNTKNMIIELLLATNRDNMYKLINNMEESGFFTAPCSGSYHLAYKGGLAEHSLNVCNIAIELLNMLYENDISTRNALYDSVILSSLLHDLGKAGQFGKPNYVPNMLKGEATKANPIPEPYQSEKKPFVTNSDLLSVDHEIRSIQIASQFIELTEEESFAILNHNGMYSVLKYSYAGKETPLSMIVHNADMWAARVVEKTKKVKVEGEKCL